MIALDTGDKIRGDAAAAAVVDYTLHGFVGTTATQLADGQLPNTIGDLYTAAADGIGVSSIILVNTDTVDRAINLYLLPSGGTARRLLPKDYSLPAGYAVFTDGKSALRFPTPGAAPTDASFVTIDAEGDLSAEYVLGTAVIMRGLAASKPAASKAGLIYIETDGSYIVWRDNGTSWDEIARGEAGIRLAQLAEKAHGSLTGVGSDDHHAQAHTLASHSTKAHSELTGVGAGDHHAKTANDEVYGLLRVGLDAAKPAAGTAERWYFATDTGILYRDTGAAWVEALRGESFTRLAQLSEKAHGSLTGVTSDLHHAQDHASRHQNGGADELSVAGLSGVLADKQDANKIQGVNVSSTPPTDNQILKYDAATSQYQPEAEAGGGGTGKMALVFPAASAILPNTNFAALVKVVGSNRVWYEARFDDGTDEAVYFMAEIPNYYGGGTIRLVLKWKAAATTGDVIWVVNIAAIDDAESGDVAGTNFTFAADTAKGTAEQDNEVILTGQTSGFVAGDRLSVKVTRDADNASDTMSGDAKFLSLTIEEE